MSPLPLLDASVVLLTHYIPLYQVRVFQEIAKRVRDFKVLLSTPIEPNRQFEIDWGGLDVTVQKSFSFRRGWRHRVGFRDELFVHVPYDTLSLLNRIRPDVVLSHELGARSIAAAMHRQWHRDSRLILCTYMSEHTEQGRGWLRNRVRRRLLKRADAVTYNGPSCKTYLRNRGVPEERLFHLPYAADDRVFTRRSLGSNGEAGNLGSPADVEELKHKFICVGQLSERKGVLRLVRQLVEYCQLRSDQPFHLTLVGEGPERDAILGVARPANFDLQIVAPQSPAALYALYMQHGCSIHPTLADEWLMVVNESLHAGVPVIGSRFAQAVETLIEDGSNGWKFDPQQQGDLQQKLDQYLSLSDEALKIMRKSAYDSISNRTPAWAAQGAIQAIHSVVNR